MSLIKVNRIENLAGTHGVDVTELVSSNMFNIKGIFNFTVDANGQGQLILNGIPSYITNVYPILQYEYGAYAPAQNSRFICYRNYTLDSGTLTINFELRDASGVAVPSESGSLVYHL